MIANKIIKIVKEFTKEILFLGGVALYNLLSLGLTILTGNLVVTPPVTRTMPPFLDETCINVRAI